eukprot:TRINITY_DN4005_c0_g1_i1.p1 TRINITY_DN4005_c0_g1~~TRINITY_DN4005_c0_g1_i1.p1  ORF type:complete len:705 (-),score=193.70 TRINITY_DN4005_c0_g1_i1:47-2161(-)
MAVPITYTSSSNATAASSQLHYYQLRKDQNISNAVSSFLSRHENVSHGSTKRRVFFDANLQQLIVILEQHPNDSNSQIPSKSSLSDIKSSTAGTSIILKASRNGAETAPISLKRENIHNAKYSPDEKYLAVQYTTNQVEFVWVQDQVSFIHASKKMPGPILGYFWTFADNIFFVTNQGIELYSFPTSSKRKEIKLIKDIKQQLNWFVYSTKFRVLLVSTGTGPTIFGFHFTPNNIFKIPKFNIDKADKAPLLPNELVITSLYGKIFAVHLNSASKEIAFYQVTREVVIKRQVLPLYTSSPVYTQVWDNLLIVHNLETKVAMVYDVRDKEAAIPVGLPLPLIQAETADPNEPQPDFYSPHWMLYQPNIVVDTNTGVLWDLFINLESIALSFSDKKRLVSFLMRRSNSKGILLRALRSIIEECEPLSTLADIFDLLNAVVSSQPEALKNSRGRGSGVASPARSDAMKYSMSSDEWNQALQHSASSDDISSMEEKNRVIISVKSIDGYDIIDQNDLYGHVFLPIEEEKGLDYKFIIAVVTEYIRSLNFNHIQVEPYLNELLINFLVRHKRFYQLHQLLQYHVVSDSVHVACQLLGIEATAGYPPAYQLALDMFKRLHTNDQILEVLLTKKQPIAAIRFMRTHRELKINPARIMEISLASEDPTMFYTVFKYFEQNNMLTNLSPAASATVAPYITKFKQMFREGRPPN